MRNKFLIIFILIALLCLSVACTHGNNEKAELIDIEYDLEDKGYKTLKNSTTLYDDAIQWLTEDYKYDNRTKPLAGADDCPSEIINIIKSREEFDKAFNEFPTEINFEEQILILCFYTADDIFSSDKRRFYYYELSNISVLENKLTIDVYKYKTALAISGIFAPDASMPTQECLAFLMPKIQVEQTELNIEYKLYNLSWNGSLKSATTLYNADINWLRAEYEKDVSFALESKNRFTDKIQNHEEYVTAFKKFYNTFDVNDEMLVLYFIKQDDNDANAYEYSIADIQYEEGYLDISLNKKVKKSQSKDGSNNVMFLVFKLPQLPAYKVNIKIN